MNEATHHSQSMDKLLTGLQVNVKLTMNLHQTWSLQNTDAEIIQEFENDEMLYTLMKRSYTHSWNTLMNTTETLWHGFAAIHVQIRGVHTSGSSTYVIVRFRQYAAQTNATFTGCKLSLIAEN